MAEARLCIKSRTRMKTGRAKCHEHSKRHSRVTVFGLSAEQQRHDRVGVYPRFYANCESRLRGKKATRRGSTRLRIDADSIAWTSPDLRILEQCTYIGRAAFTRHLVTHSARSFVLDRAIAIFPIRKIDTGPLWYWLFINEQLASN